MISKRYSKKQAMRLLAYRHARIQNLYFSLVDDSVHVWHLTVQDAVTMLSVHYKTASKMTPAQLQHRLNLIVGKLQPNRMEVFFHVEGADLPTFPSQYADPTAVTDAWTEYEAHMKSWRKLQANLLGI